MASLTGTKIKDTYDALLKVSDNGALDGTLQTITDGLGNNSALSLSTAGASVGGTLAVSGGITGTISTAAQPNITSVGTLSSLTTSGVVSSAGLTLSTNDSLFDTDGSILKHSVIGLTLKGVAASVFDFSIYSADETALLVNPAGTRKLRVSSGDDVSFNDSSANEAFYWDASAASLGIGTTSPFSVNGNNLEVSSTGVARLLLNSSSTGHRYAFQSQTDGALGLYDFTADTERMRIDSSGNVGIGVSPSAWSTISALQVKNAFVGGVGNNSYFGANLYYDGTFYRYINSDYANFYTQQSTGHSFYTAPLGTAGGVASVTERMRINSEGNLLVGCTGVPGAGGSIQGASLLSSGAISVYRAAAPSGYFARSNDGELIAFFNNTAQVGSISIGASSTAYNTSSDYRLKEDWVAMEGALDRVDALKPINFAWKADGKRVDGFLAHELAEVIPEAVTGEKDATEIRSVEVSPAVYEEVIHPAEEAILDEEGNVIQEAKEEWVEKVLVSEAVFEDQEFPVYQGIDQSKIVPLLAAGLQEAHALIKELRAELNALKQA